MVNGFGLLRRLLAALLLAFLLLFLLWKGECVPIVVHTTISGKGSGLPCHRDFGRARVWMMDDYHDHQSQRAWISISPQFREDECQSMEHECQDDCRMPSLPSLSSLSLLSSLSSLSPLTFLTVLTVLTTLATHLL